MFFHVCKRGHVPCVIHNCCPDSQVPVKCLQAFVIITLQFVILESKNDILSLTRLYLTIRYNRVRLEPMWTDIWDPTGSEPERMNF